ncbi:MAG: 50S ribosomal protein L3 [Rickettsiales bacterium TMED254]|nr:50S ribosomal protein L3 [Rickettsiales bacterium]RPF77584.1 MAG: 50S ribosomal protein L3 [Rickettsiales bacterium TMED254]
MRTGLIAKKVGMSRVFKADGSNIPVTLLKVDNCTVVEHRILEKNGYSALRLSYGVSKKNKINKPTKGFFKKNKNEGSNTTKEFRVTKDAFLDIGSILKPNHFINGQYVDVSGFSIGKGFAGGMKRHNFAGNRASHGVSISHRSHGSTGQCQDPGKVFKGKKMAGRLGNVKRTMQNLEVINTDNQEGLIIIKGSVPGPKGLIVTVCDAIKNNSKDLPYPTNQVSSSETSNKENLSKEPVETKNDMSDEISKNNSPSSNSEKNNFEDNIKNKETSKKEDDKDNNLKQETSNEKGETKNES